jgi:hypothetical protein
MKTARSLLALGSLLVPALLWGQTVATDVSDLTGSVSAGGDAVAVHGDRGRFQEDQQVSSRGAGGIYDLQYSHDLNSATTFTFSGHAVVGNGDYQFEAKLANPDLWSVDLGYDQFRVWYDGSGGYFPGTGSWLPVDGDALYVDRGHLWFEAAYTPDQGPHYSLRYDLNTRQGTKDSTEWGDINLPVYGTRNIVPTLLYLDEHTQTITAAASQSTDVQQWNLGAEYEHTSIDDQEEAARQPGTSASRDLTTSNFTTSDLFATDGFFERRLSKRFTFSTGAMASTLDTNLNGGNRVYGSVFDAAFSPVYANRQSHDEGYYDLTGGANLKDYAGNVNLEYRPNPAWKVASSFRMEDTQTDSLSDYVTTNVSSTNGPVSLTDESGESNEHWLDTAERLVATYEGQPNWVATVTGDWDQGSGNLVQDSIDLDTATASDQNNTDYNQVSGRIAVNANWYVRPGLTISAEAYRRTVDDQYLPILDSSADNYPVFILQENIATTDGNMRVNWRPRPLLSFTTRYDYQRSAIRDAMAGLPAVDSSRYLSQIVSETVTTDPLPRLYVTASVNVAFNQLGTPATGATVIKNGDSNYVDGSVGAGYALGKVTDVDVDYSMYTTDNFIDDSATTLPYGGAEHQNTATVTWVRRQSSRLVYTVRYTFADYRDSAVGGLNNYTGSVVYAKVQYLF